MAETLLDVQDVKIRYGGIEAVKGISVRVDQGELVTLIGGNGAGKSTTLRTISGIKRPSEGSITFLGERVDELTPDEIVDLGLSHVPEGRRIFPRMSVRENLEMGGYARRSKDFGEDFDRVFTLFPVLKERERQLGGTLSGGEQQMLAIGRGLMARPVLLMLDEPSMGLAPLLVERIFDLLREIHEQGTTILLVEQNALMALDAANRGYVLETGHVALEGPASELRDNEQVRKTYLGED
jgi:branched-chain amino acid transport system ATP-binding protein